MYEKERLSVLYVCRIRAGAGWSLCFGCGRVDRNHHIVQQAGRRDGMGMCSRGLRGVEEVIGRKGIVTFPLGFR